MKSDIDDVNRVLNKNIEYELEAIGFYAKNLSKLNYSKNKEKIDALLLGSVAHANMIIKQLLSINAGEITKLDSIIKDIALKEEIGMKELYEFELLRTESADMKKLLKELVAQEKSHESLVKSLV